MAPKLFAMFAQSQIMMQSLKRVGIAKFAFNSMKSLSSQSVSEERVNPIEPLSSQSVSEERVNPIEPLSSQSRSGEQDLSLFKSSKPSEPIISYTTIRKESGRGKIAFPGGTFAELYCSVQLTKLFKEAFLSHKNKEDRKVERHEDDEHIFDQYVEPTEITFKGIDGQRKVVSWKGGKLSELKFCITEIRDIFCYENIDGDESDDKDEKEIDHTDGKKNNFEYSQSTIDEEFAKYTAEKDLKK